LQNKGKVEEAIACYRKAIALNPRYANAHYNLGDALKAKGKVDEAIACFHKAITFDPKLALAYYYLGVALDTKGKAEAAITCYRQAIYLDPNLADAHTHLGVALAVKGKAEEAITCFRQAIFCDPKYALAHYNLGNVLGRQGKMEGAIACFRRALVLDPKLAHAHSALGVALQGKGKVEEAIACFRKAIALVPKHAWAHAALGHALLHKGRFAEARDASARALQRLPQGDPLRTIVSRQLQECRRLATLEEKLAPILRGDAAPAGAEQCLEVAALCQRKQWHATAARFAADAFLARAKLADDLQQPHRYNAACSAALAGCGQGEDASKLTEKQRSGWRGQALDWLRADLVLRCKQLETDKPADRAAVQQALRHWQKDTDLAGLRDAAALAKLPADEQKAFTQLWSDVAALLKKAEGKTK
jgi:tetratricopeptide (TPR) repeat protein